MPNLKQLYAEFQKQSAEKQEARRQQKLDDLAEYHRYFINNNYSTLLSQVIHHYSNLEDSKRIVSVSQYASKISKPTLYTPNCFAPYNELYFGFNPITNEPEITSHKKANYLHFENIYDYNAQYSNERKSQLSVIHANFRAFCEILETNGILFDYIVDDDITIIVAPKNDTISYIA